MKISELQEVLSKAKEQYGDLAVETITGANMVKFYYGEVNGVRIIRTDIPQVVNLGETLDDNARTTLRLIGVREEEE